jgi:hypothetical protein
VAKALANPAQNLKKRNQLPHPRRKTMPDPLTVSLKS